MATVTKTRPETKPSPPLYSDLGYVIIAEMRGPITYWKPVGGLIVIDAYVEVTKKVHLRVREPIQVFGSDGVWIYTSTSYPQAMKIVPGDRLLLELKWVVNG